MKKTLGFSVFLVLAVTTQAANAQAAEGNGTQANACSAVRKKISSIQALFAKEGDCDLRDDSLNHAIRDKTYDQALGNFRKLKQDFLDSYYKKSSDTPYTTQYQLFDIQSTIQKYLTKNKSDHPDLSQAFRMLYAKIGNLDKAVLAIDHLNATNSTRVAAIQNSIQELQYTCPRGDCTDNPPMGALDKAEELLASSTIDSKDADLQELKTQIHKLVSPDLPGKPRSTVMTRMQTTMDGFEEILECRDQVFNLSQAQKAFHADSCGGNPTSSAATTPAVFKIQDTPACAPLPSYRTSLGDACEEPASELTYEATFNQVPQAGKPNFTDAHYFSAVPDEPNLSPKTGDSGTANPASKPGPWISL